MRRQDFLKELQSYLSVELSPAQVQAQLDFYDHYIRETMQEGKSEEEVLESLGSPHLIAKTILQAGRSRGADAGEGRSYRDSQGYYDGSGYHSSQDYWQAGGWQQGRGDWPAAHSKAARWVILAVTAVLLVLLFSLVGSLLVLIGRFLLPVLLVLAAAAWIRRRNGR